MNIENEANDQNEYEFEEVEEETEYKTNANKIRPEVDEQLVVSLQEGYIKARLQLFMEQSFRDLKIFFRELKKYLYSARINIDSKEFYIVKKKKYILF